MVYEFQCGLCNEAYYRECIRHFAGRNGENIGISPLTKKGYKPEMIALSAIIR